MIFGRGNADLAHPSHLISVCPRNSTWGKKDRVLLSSHVRGHPPTGRPPVEEPQRCSPGLDGCELSWLRFTNARAPALTPNERTGSRHRCFTFFPPPLTSTNYRLWVPTSTSRSFTRRSRATFSASFSVSGGYSQSASYSYIPRQRYAHPFFRRRLLLRYLDDCSTMFTRSYLCSRPCFGQGWTIDGRGEDKVWRRRTLNNL